MQNDFNRQTDRKERKIIVAYKEMKAKYFDKNGKVDIKEHVEKEVLEEHTVNNIIESKVVGNIYYAALKQGDEVIPIIIQTHISNNIGSPVFGYYGVMYDDNQLAPTHTDCPACILDLLTTPTNNKSLEWRLKCRRTLYLKAKRKSIQRIINNAPDGTEFKVSYFCDKDYVNRICYKNGTSKELYYVPDRRDRCGQRVTRSVQVKNIVECQVYVQTC